MIGTLTPARRPISGAYMPPALTTTSASIVDPLAVVLHLDARHPPVAHADADDPVVVAGSRHAALAGPGRQRERQVRRVEPAVGRQPDRAQHAVGGHQREAVRASARRDQLERQPEGRGPAGLPLELLVAGRRRRQAQRARPRATTGRRPVSAASRRYRSTPYIIIRVRVTELRSWPTSPALWNVEPDVSSARSTQHDVGPAELGEVVRDRRPADAAADDHRPRVLDHRLEALLLLP